MSLWHSPQVSESMKKFDGMMPPTFVFAADGKKGDDGPPPSPAIDSGAVDGFAIRVDGAGWVRAYSATPNGSASATIDAPAAVPAHARARPPERSARRPIGTRAATAAAP